MSDETPPAPDSESPPVQPPTPATVEPPASVSTATEQATTPAAAEARATEEKPGDKPEVKKNHRLFDAPTVGRLLLVATIILFCWIVVSAGRNRDEGSLNGYFVWPSASAAASDTIRVRLSRSKSGIESG